MSTFLVKTVCSLALMTVAIYGTYSGLRWYHMLSERSATAATGKDDGTPPRPLSEFTFTERSGQPLSLKKLEGKVWVASFFFASCPGFCTQMNQVIAGLERELKDQDVTFVSVTVDPRNDTPERLAEYAKHFGADPQRWLFLSGPFEDAHELGEKIFHVTVVPKDHTDRLIIVDRKGQVRGTFRATDPTQVAMFKKEIKKLLAEAPKEERDEGDKSNDRESNQ
jgi:cytochrome oxidase Cu insertion factor (SCO1/SenC/PrrC family)